MSGRKAHEIWIEQCDAAQDIKLRYGLQAAFDYVVAEKLLNFADAAARYPNFARELPRFVSRVRYMFTAQELQTHLVRLEHEQRKKDAVVAEEDDVVEEDDPLVAEEDEMVAEEDEVITESPAVTAERVRQFAAIKELLTASQLGTS